MIKTHHSIITFSFVISIASSGLGCSAPIKAQVKPQKQSREQVQVKLQKQQQTDYQVDKFAAWNRPVYKFNKVVDTLYIQPWVVLYDKLVPQFLKTGFSNFFKNLKTVPILANDILQGDWDRAGQDCGRFLVNSSFGIGGLIDVADHWSGVKYRSNDFGITLAKWSKSANYHSTYLVLPLLGPTTGRDLIGLAVDNSLSLQTHWQPKWRNRSLAGNVLVARHELYKNQKTLDAASLDEYALVRGVFLQRRQYLIKQVLAPDASVLEAETLDGPPE